MSNAPSEGRPEPGRRNQYAQFMPVQTRWKDNDVYGHVNNVEYYSYFDTVVNRYLIDPGGLDFHTAPIVGIMAETMCRFHRSFAYPEAIDAGLRVGRLGKSSVRYEVGLFGEGEDSCMFSSSGRPTSPCRFRPASARHWNASWSPDTRANGQIWRPDPGSIPTECGAL